VREEIFRGIPDGRFVSENSILASEHVISRSAAHGSCHTTHKPKFGVTRTGDHPILNDENRVGIPDPMR
jgi:hypothetical protein